MLLQRYDDAWSYRGPQPAAPGLSLTWHGTAGFTVEAAGHTLVIDPFLTRPGLLATGLSRLVPDEALVARYVPRADDVLVGHAHHDHVLDAPSVCRRTGARLIGSPDVCNVGRAAGLPEAQLLPTRGREALASGPFTVRGLPSRHGKVYFGRVTLPGDIPVPPPWPPRVTDLRHGLVLNWHVTTPAGTLVHVDSADFIDDEWRGLGCDVLCLCAIGRAARPRYVEDAVALLKPRFVIPCHWDWFFSPLDAPARLLPGVDLPGMVRDITAAGATPVVLPLLGRFGL